MQKKKLKKFHLKNQSEKDKINGLKLTNDNNDLKRFLRITGTKKALPELKIDKVLYKLRERRPPKAITDKISPLSDSEEKDKKKNPRRKRNPSLSLNKEILPDILSTKSFNSNGENSKTENKLVLPLNTSTNKPFRLNDNFITNQRSRKRNISKNRESLTGKTTNNIKPIQSDFTQKSFNTMNTKPQHKKSFSNSNCNLLMQSNSIKNITAHLFNGYYNEKEKPNYLKLSAKKPNAKLRKIVPEMNESKSNIEINSATSRTISKDKAQIKKANPLKVSPLLTFQSLSAPVNQTLFSSKSQTLLKSFKYSYVEEYAYNTHNGIVRNYNEDSVSIIPKLNRRGDFFAIFDGHGGKNCSLFLQQNFHTYIKNFTNEDINKAVSECENDFFSKHAFNEKGELVDRSGSCAVFVIVTNDNKGIISNIGDSRCVIINKDNEITFSTRDHKPSDKGEHDRIIKAGGSVYQNPMTYPVVQNGELIKNGPHRILPGRLSVSRSIGDAEAKDPRFGGNENVLISTPEIYNINAINDNRYIILGCDGIFDVLTNDELIFCVTLAEKHSRENVAGTAADYILKSAMLKESFDNISVIVIKLKHLE